jgi:hypothetical protein
LTKIRKLLRRQRGTDVPYATLHRYAVAELGFGSRAATVALADGEPGRELQLDTGWMTYLEPNAEGKRRRFRAWVFTPGLSRYRFVWPSLREQTKDAIEACEAAWAFYGGTFSVIIPDNTKAIVDHSDATDPTINRTFLEYAQARGFYIDPTRARHPKDKARVERSVSFVRDDCFGGERLSSIDVAREHARTWCVSDAGLRRHRRTHRIPREHFDAEERACLGPAPTAPYDTPLWCTPKVAKDHLAQVDRALYSLPTHLIGKRLTARADRHLVRFYDRNRLVKTHPRKPPGGRSIDAGDYPAHKSAYALRDVDALCRQARRHGEAVEAYARALLDVPLPWTSMRRVYSLLGLVRRYSASMVDDACKRALAAELVNVKRLERMLAIAKAPETKTTSRVPSARFLRPVAGYAIDRVKVVREGGQR